MSGLKAVLLQRAVAGATAKQQVNAQITQGLNRSRTVQELELIEKRRRVQEARNSPHRGSTAQLAAHAASAKADRRRQSTVDPATHTRSTRKGAAVMAASVPLLDLSDAISAANVPQPLAQTLDGALTPENLWRELDRVKAQEAQADELLKFAQRRMKQAEMKKQLDSQAALVANKRREEVMRDRYFGALQVQQAAQDKAVEEVEKQKKRQQAAAIRAVREEQLRIAKERTLTELKQQHALDVDMVERDKAAAEAIKAKEAIRREEHKRRMKQLQIENQRKLAVRAAEAAAEFKHDQELTKEFQEILARQDAAREKALKELYSKQQKMMDFGKFSRPDAALLAQADERRAEQVRLEIERKLNAEAKAKEDARRQRDAAQQAAIAQQLEIQRRRQQEEYEHDLALQHQVLEHERLLQQQDLEKQQARRQREREYGEELESQIVEDRIRRRHEAAVGAMNNTEVILNRRIIEEARATKDLVMPPLPGARKTLQPR